MNNVGKLIGITLGGLVLTLSACAKKESETEVVVVEEPQKFTEAPVATVEPDSTLESQEPPVDQQDASGEDSAKIVTFKVISEEEAKEIESQADSTETVSK